MHIKTVTLMVKDIKRSLDFYQQRIGMKLIDQKDDLYTLGTYENIPLIKLISNPNARPKSRTTELYHFAILLPSRAYLGQFIQHMINTRTQVTGGADHGISEALYLDDPDGNGIEIYADRPVDLWPPFDDAVNAPMDYQDLIDNQVKEPFLHLPNGTIMGHIHLHVSNIDKGIKFFEGVLGFRETMAYGPHAHFSSDAGYHHHLGFNVWAGIGVPNNPDDAVGLKAYDLFVPNDQFEDFKERIESNNYELKADEKGLYLIDINNVRIDIIKG